MVANGDTLYGVTKNSHILELEVHSTVFDGVFIDFETDLLNKTSNNKIHHDKYFGGTFFDTDGGTFHPSSIFVNIEDATTYATALLDDKIKVSSEKIKECEERKSMLLKTLRTEKIRKNLE